MNLNRPAIIIAQYVSMHGIVIDRPNNDHSRVYHLYKITRSSRDRLIRILNHIPMLELSDSFIYWRTEDWE